MHHNLSQIQIEQKISGLLSFLGILNKKEAFPDELSIGQQQKVAIARALVKDPVIIFADEPTGEMDPLATKEIINKLQELNKKSNLTIIVASHDNLFTKICDRTIYLNDGKISTKHLAGY
jgi:putative ABC transport system ATP-binding protein